MEENPQSITLVRTFKSPVEKVWDAWTTPEGWSAWYGKPWEVLADQTEIDPRVGGKWKSTTIAEGQEIRFMGEYTEFDKPNKLVMTIKLEGMPGDNFETGTAIFKKIDDNTTEMTFTQSGNLPPEEYAKGLKEGWTGFFNALEKYLSN